MRTQIKGSVCFVTGSSRGIGRAIVEELVKAGAAKVYASARNKGALKALAASSGGKVVPVALDVTKDGQIRAAAKAAPDTQILINNAGVANFTSAMSAAGAKSARQEMDVNFFGSMNTARAFGPVLKKNGGGTLVNICSVVGLVGMPVAGTYSASKAAVHSLTQSLRGELKAQGTLVICVYPGPIDTDMIVDFDIKKESPRNVACEIFKGIESGAEEVYPDNAAKEFAVKLKADPKAVEKEWSAMVPQQPGAR